MFVVKVASFIQRPGHRPVVKRKCKTANQTKFRKLETKFVAFSVLVGGMEVLFEGCYHEHISQHALKIHAFCKSVAAFHRCSLKQLFWNMWSCSIKIYVVDSVFSSVGGRALSSLLKLVTTTDIFHHFFLRFQYNHLLAFLPTAPSINTQKYNTKFR